MIKKIWYLSFAVLVFSGCASALPPLEDYALARSAMDAAKAVDAVKYAPSYYRKAETFYHQAQVLFENHEYNDARSEFDRARQYAERAENSARIQRFKNGEIL